VPMPVSRTSVVDAELAAYISAHSTPPDDVQRQLMAATEARTGRAQGMQIGGDQGTMFEILARSIGARSAIEIGTFTGYSSMSLARGMGPEGRLICCDVGHEWTAIAREHWELAGLDDRIDLRIGPALDTIASLPAELSFDLAFIDADKTNYANYYAAILPRMRATGMILVDNTLWSRQVLDDADGDPDPDTAALRAFNDMIAADERVRCVIVPIGDGVTMIQPAGITAG
jgi:caffeoyl-CoA O-methyltransferase